MMSVRPSSPSRCATAHAGVHLVHDADLDSLVHAARDPLVLGGQLGLDLRADVRRDVGQPASVQDPDRRDGTHHRDLGARPGEDLGGTQ